MNAPKIISQIDRWGTIVLVYLLPWQARLIFSQGYLAGAPAESQTRSLYAVEVLIAVLFVVRLARIATDEKRRPFFPAKSRRNEILIAFAAVVALVLFSAVVSFDPAASFVAAWRLAEGFAVFYIFATAASEREIRFAFIAGALVQAAIAVTQVCFQRIYADPWLGLAAHDPAALGTSVVEAGGRRLLRAYAFFPHPNIFGGMMAVAILAARPVFRRVNVVSMSAYFLLTVGLFLSFSRAAVLALLVGMAVQWLWARRDAVFMKNMAVVLATLAFMSVIFWPFVFARTAAAGRLENKSVAARLASLDDAWQLVKKHPSTGVGAGAFSVAILKEVDPGRDGYALEPAHNAPLAVFAEIGFFGLLLFLWLLYLAARCAWKSGKIGLAAALVVLAFGDHWAWTTYAGIIVFWAGWGLAMRHCHEGEKRHKAGAIIVSGRDPNKILVMYRHGPEYDDWTFPKGHMEPGELREDTMHREVREETGLRVEIIRPLPDRKYVTGRGHETVLHLFLARSLDDSKLRPEAGRPGNKLEWVGFDEVERRLTFDNMKDYWRKTIPDINEGLADYVANVRS